MLVMSVGDPVSHPEIFISECEPFSERKSNFLKDFVYFHLKWFYLNLFLYLK
jgi:hypothetical protein